MAYTKIPYMILGTHYTLTNLKGQQYVKNSTLNMENNHITIKHIVALSMSNFLIKN